jgi:hypothetical protein
MKKQYMIYHPATNSSPLRAFSIKDHFINLDSENFSPFLYKNIGAAKAAVSFAISDARHRPNQLSELKEFLVGVQIVEVDISVKEVAYEYLFNLDKIIKK